MTATPMRRTAAVCGLACAAAVALWWLFSSRLALAQGADARRCSAEALQALWLVRMLALALSGPRVAALQGWQAGVANGLGLVSPAWPVVVLAWSASTLPVAAVAGSELLLLLGVAALALPGWALRRAALRPALVEPAATLLAVAAAGALWAARGLWTPLG
jgi:hypothetical protein